MYLLIAFSILALALMLLAVRGRSVEVRDPSAAGNMLSEVDLDAFRNLIDLGQDRFLRAQLSPRDFRRVQRARSLAAADYLRKVAANASVMLRVGESIRDGRNPALAAMGADMVSSAINIRLNCILALAQAYVGVVLPGMGISVAGAVDRYDRLVMRLHAVRHTLTSAPGAALSRSAQAR